MGCTLITYMSNQGLCHLDVVVKRSKVQRREAIILGLVNGGTEGEIGQDESYGTHVASEGCMVEGIEAVVIGNGVVSLELQQKLNNVVTLLGYGIMKGRVTLRILGHVCIIIKLLCGAMM